MRFFFFFFEEHIMRHLIITFVENPINEDVIIQMQSFHKNCIESDTPPKKFEITYKFNKIS